LNLEEVTHLCLVSLALLVDARKDSLKTLLLDGEYVTDDFFRHLAKLKRLESLGIAFAESISSQGMEAISELRNLTSLKLMRAKELLPIEFITTFSSPKLERLTSLNLSECGLLDDNSLSAIAGTCKMLKVIFGLIT
jgi:Leucine-rich repeat (LRR) protein